MIFAIQRLSREPVCDFRAFPIPTLPSLFDSIEYKTAYNMWRYTVSVALSTQTMLPVEPQYHPR